MSKTTLRQGNKITETITRFNDSLTTNTRNSDGFTFAKHFINYPDRLALRPALVQDTDITEYYAIEKGDDTNDEVLLLGQESATDKLFGISLAENPTVSAIVNATFEEPSWLFRYKETAFYYNGTSLNYTTDLWGSPAQTTGYKTLTKATRTRFDLVRPFVHPTDDYAYFFDSNNVYQLTDEPGTGTWTQASITIPSGSEICAACPYGEYIAIFAYEIGTSSTSVYIWDRSLTLETFIDVKTWLGREVYAAGTIGGNLVGVATNDDSPLDRGIAVSAYTGNSVTPLNTMMPNYRGSFSIGTQEEVGFNGGSFDTFHPILSGGKLYFPGLSDDNGKGTVFELDQKYEIRMPYSNLGVSPTHIAITGRGVFMMSNEDNDFYYTRNVGAIVLTTTGQYITTIFDGNDGFEVKQPDRVRAWHSPILTGGSVKIEYWAIINDVANTGGWVTIGTNSTPGTTRTSFSLVSSTNQAMNQGQEFYYRITVDRVSFVFGFQAESHIINTTE